MPPQENAADDRRLDRAPLEQWLLQAASLPWPLGTRAHVTRYLDLVAAAADPAVRIDMCRWLALWFRRRSLARSSRHPLRAALRLALAAEASARELGAPETLAKALDTVANVKFDLGDRHGDLRALLEAERAFKEAIEGLGPSGPFYLLGPLNNNLAGVYASRHRRDGGHQHLTGARCLYRTVRRLAARARKPLDWALAVSNIARMERDAAQINGDIVGLERAARWFRRALAQLEKIDQAEQAAATRHSLAITLHAIAERAYQRDAIEGARRLWLKNAEIWTPQTNAAKAAELQHSLARLDITTGVRENNIAGLLRAAEVLSRLTGLQLSRGAGDRKLSTAPWAHERSPENFVTATLSLANVLCRIAALDGDPEHLRFALLAIETATGTHDIEAERLSYADLLRMRGVVQAELGAATANRELHRCGEAVQLEALRIYESLEATGRISSTLNELGACLVAAPDRSGASGDMERARNYFEKAIRLQDAESNGALAQEARINLLKLDFRIAAQAGSAEGLQSVCREIAARAREAPQAIAPGIETRLQLLDVRAQFAIFRLRAERVAARSLLAQIEQILSRPHLPAPAAIELEIGAGWLHKAAGNVDRAIENWDAAQDRVWRALIEVEGLGARKQLIALATCKAGDSAEAYSLADGLSLGDELALALVERGRPGDLERAVAAIERGRRMLRAATDLLEASNPGEPMLCAMRDRYRTAVADYDGLNRVVQHGGDGGSRLRAFAKRHAEARRRVVEAETAIVSHLQDRGLRRAPVPDFEQVAGAIAPSTFLVVVAAGKGGSAAIVVRKDYTGSMTFDCLALPALNRSVIDAMLLGVPDEGSEGGFLKAAQSLGGVGLQPGLSHNFASAAAGFSGVLEQIAEKLQHTMMGPIDRYLRRAGGHEGASVVLMVPGTLAALPLQIAYETTSCGSRAYFIQSWTVRFTPDLRTLVASAKRVEDAAARPPGILSVLDPCEDLGIGETGIGQTASWGRVTCIFGREATVERVCEELPRHDIFAFDGHAVYDWEHRDRSGLALAHRDLGSGAEPQRELLTIERIRALSTSNRRLCVLAACETAMAPGNDLGDEFDSVAFEFLELGYGGVLAANWSVATTSTSEIMTTFWDTLLSGNAATPVPPASALRSAQLRWLAKAVRRPADTARGGLQRAGPDNPSSEDGSANCRRGRALPPLDQPFWWGAFKVIGQ